MHVCRNRVAIRLFPLFLSLSLFFHRRKRGNAIPPGQKGWSTLRGSVYKFYRALCSVFLSAFTVHAGAFAARVRFLCDFLFPVSLLINAPDPTSILAASLDSIIVPFKASQKNHWLAIPSRKFGFLRSRSTPRRRYCSSTLVFLTNFNFDLLFIKRVDGPRFTCFSFDREYIDRLNLMHFPCTTVFLYRDAILGSLSLRSTPFRRP